MNEPAKKANWHVQSQTTFYICNAYLITMNDKKWPWTLQCQSQDHWQIGVTIVYGSFTLFRCMTNRFRLTRHFVTSALTEVKCTIHMCVLLVSFNPKFQSVSLLDQIFFCYRAFWHKCKKRAPNDIEHYRIKGTPHIFWLEVRSSSKLQYVSLRPGFFI